MPDYSQGLDAMTSSLTFGGLIPPGLPKAGPPAPAPQTPAPSQIAGPPAPTVPPANPVNTETSDVSLTDAINSYPPSNQYSFNNLSGADTQGNVSTPDPNAISQQLNDAQNQAYSQLPTSPSQTDDRQALANNLFSNYFQQSQSLTSAGNAAVTGSNDLRTQTQSLYGSLGLSQASDDLAQARSALQQIQTQKADNLTQVENRNAGSGATEGFAQSLDSKEQRTIALKEIAANIKLEAATQAYNAKLDAFKVFTQSASTEQKNTLDSVSQQLGLDKQDLAMGVSIMNQIRQENKSDQTLAKQTFFSLLTNVPGIASKLTPQEIQAMQTTGNIPPSVVAKVGQTYKDIQDAQKQQQLAINQQNANTGSTNAATNQGKLTVSQALAQSTINKNSIDTYSGLLTKAADIFSKTGVDITSTPEYQAELSQAYNQMQNPAPSSIQPQLAAAHPDGSTGGWCGAFAEKLVPDCPKMGDTIQSKDAMINRNGILASQWQQNPQVGDVLVMNIGKNGHAAVVNSVNPDGTVTLSESNYNLDAKVNNNRTIPITDKSIYGAYRSPQVSGLFSQGQQSSNNKFGLSGMASQYADSIQPTSTGANYIDLNQIKAPTKALQQQIITQLNQKGIATLSHDQATQLQNIEDARANLKQMQQNISSLPGSGVGRFFTGFGITRKISEATGLGQAGKYKGFDDIADSLGGLYDSINRLNRPAGTAFNIVKGNVPHSTSDTQETAQAFIDQSQTQLDNAEKAVLGKFAPAAQSHDQYSDYFNSLGGQPINQQQNGQ